MEALFKDQFIKILNKQSDLWDIVPIEGNSDCYEFRFVSEKSFEILGERYAIDTETKRVHRT